MCDNPSFKVDWTVCSRQPPQLSQWRLLCCGVLVRCAGLAGAVSRTATAPVDRLKMLLQVQEGRRMSIQEGMRLMQAEGAALPVAGSCMVISVMCMLHSQHLAVTSAALARGGTQPKKAVVQVAYPAAGLAWMFVKQQQAVREDSWS